KRNTAHGWSAADRRRLACDHVSDALDKIECVVQFYVEEDSPLWRDFTEALAGAREWIEELERPCRWHVFNTQSLQRPTNHLETRAYAGDPRLSGGRGRRFKS